MRLKQAEEACALWQAREQMPPIARQPAIKGTITDALDGKDESQRDDLAWMLHLEEQQSDQNQVLLALRALSDYYIANISHFAGDGHYHPEKRSTIHGSSKHQQYVGFLRSTVDMIFKARKWSPTAILNKLAEAGALSSTEKNRHTKKVCVEGVKHRMVCIKWSIIFPEEEDSATDTKSIKPNESSSLMQAD
jgi:hypothetical protein